MTIQIMILIIMTPARIIGNIMIHIRKIKSRRPEDEEDEDEEYGEEDEDK